MQPTTSYKSLINSLCQPINNSLIGTNGYFENIVIEFGNMMREKETRISDIYYAFI